jgi:hypothetical protein
VNPAFRRRNEPALRKVPRTRVERRLDVDDVRLLVFVGVSARIR